MLGGFHLSSVGLGFRALNVPILDIFATRHDEVLGMETRYNGSIPTALHSLKVCRLVCSVVDLCASTLAGRSDFWAARVDSYSLWPQVCPTRENHTKNRQNAYFTSKKI